MTADNHARDVSPLHVLQAWFDAHRRGDLDAASALMVPGAPVRVGGRQLAGFDEFMQWYADRRTVHGPAFGYEVIDLLGGDEHAAAIIVLDDGRHRWRQVAVYRIERGFITAVDAYEDEPAH